MTAYGPRTVVEWLAVAVAALIVAGITAHTVAVRFERRIHDRLEQDRLERQERYAAGAQAAAIAAARHRHPSSPARQYQEVVIARFEADLAELPDVY